MTCLCAFIQCLSPDGKLQAELAECRAQVEHWQGVATICELSKQEELAELQKQCDQEIQSLQEALRGETAFLMFPFFSFLSKDRRVKQSEKR